MKPSEFEQRVLASLDHATVAFTEGRPEFFDVYAKDAMIFATDTTDPIKGREAYRQHYQGALTSGRREKTILSRSVQIIGDKAVVTQTARIAEPDGTPADVRQTVVYGETNEGLKIVHSHTARLAPSGAAADAVLDGLPPLRVVNERIATIADVAGVAQ